MAGGQLNDLHFELADHPGFGGTGAQLRDWCVERALESGVELHLERRVAGLDAAARALAVGEEWFRARHVVLATGVRPRGLDVPGAREMTARGEIFRGSRDAERFRGRHVVVVGGGDRAVENALLLAARGASVSLLCRHASLRARPALRADLETDGHIAVFTKATVRRILGRDAVRAVEVSVEGEAHVLPAAAVFVYIGAAPQTSFVEGLALDADGRIRTDAWGRTSAADVYAVGDVRTPAAYASVSTCCGQAMAVAKQIAGPAGRSTIPRRSPAARAVP
jgi:thioredoxin reductase (NADPH)